MTQGYAKPLPSLNDVNRPFWEGVHQGKFLIQKCAACSAVRFPPKEACTKCYSTEAEWVPASGEGTVYTFIVQHRAPGPAWQGDVPYVIAVVELAEGPHLMTNVVNCDPDSVHVGMRVRVVYEKATAEMSMFRFEPAP